MLNAGGDVVIEDDRLKAGERGTCGLHLSCDIDAVSVLAYHSAQSFDLPSMRASRRSTLSLVSCFTKHLLCVQYTPGGMVRQIPWGVSLLRLEVLQQSIKRQWVSVLVQNASLAQVLSLGKGGLHKIT